MKQNSKKKEKMAYNSFKKDAAKMGLKPKQLHEAQLFFGMDENKITRYEEEV